MKHSMFVCRLLIHLLVIVPVTGLAEIWDVDREAMIAFRLSEEVISGELVWLGIPPRRTFASVFTRATPNTRTTAVILLHGMGAHPDWPVVISPLRKNLQQGHWSSLSLQLPVLPADRSVADYGRTLRESTLRIRSGVDYLIGKHYKRIVIIGYGFGAAVALEYMVRNKPGPVSGFISVSMLARKFLEPRVDLLSNLEKLDMPILDIYGSADMSFVLETADDRRLYAGKNSSHFLTQRMIEGADHYYTDREPALFDLISDWLDDLYESEATQGNP